MQIKDYPLKTLVSDNDLFLIQDGADSSYRSIAKKTLVTDNTSTVVSTSGLIADYRFDQGSGQQLTDYSGNAYHGTLGSGSSTDSQDPAWTNWASCGLDFSGSQYVQLPSNVWFTGDLTFEACFYPRTYPNYSKIISLGNGPFSDNILLNMSYGTTGQAGLQILNGSTDGGNISPVSSIPLLQWSYLQASLSGTKITFYRNTTLCASGTSTVIPKGITRTLNYIGKSHWSGDSYFDGIIACMRFYNRVLSSSERLSNYLITKDTLSGKGIII